MIEKFQRDIVVILWLAGSVFLSLALFSYNPNDPSLNTTGTSSVVQNLCGYFGSFLSDIFYQVFGISAWVFVLAGIRKAYFHLSQRNSTRKVSGHISVVFFALFIVTASSLVSLYFSETKIFNSTIYASGLLGLFATKGLITVFNKAGVSIILWSTILVLTILYTEKSLKEFKDILLPVSLKRSLINLKDSMVMFFKGLFKSVKIHKPKRPTVESKTLNALEARIIKASEKESDDDEFEDDELEELHELEEIAEELGIEEDDDDEPMGAEAERKPHFIIQKMNERKSHITQAEHKKIKRIEKWELPKLSILESAPAKGLKVDERAIKENTFLLEDKLSQFSVKGQVVAVRPGPAVTMYEFKPNADVKISKITELADDISLALSSESVRIIAPLPGRDVVGIESANPNRAPVYLKEIVEDKTFWDEKVRLPIALGKEAGGDPKTVDLRKMPHLLVAGTTGSGKSVFINSLLTGLLFKHSPKTLKLILVDPKQVDLAAFHNVPHLIMPPIKEPKKAVVSLRWAVREMEKRYRSMSRFKTRSIEEFNKAVSDLSKQQASGHQAYNDELEAQNRSNVEGYYHNEIPYIVIIVEEFGDLMAVDKSNTEQLIVRLAQMARACGMHLVLAMQSPRRDVVTGLIKTNIPGRISFKVASKTDSRIILDEAGAERLLAQGDMLFLAPGVSKPQRHHGAWVSEPEIHALTSFWSKQSEPDFDPAAMKVLSGSGGGFEFSDGSSGTSFDGEPEEGSDERYDELLAYVSGLKEVSASLLQRKFRLGYPRAARIIEIFEKEGVVGPSNGSKPRQVLINKL